MIELDERNQYNQGVYCIKNTKTNKIYVGSVTYTHSTWKSQIRSFRKRKQEHWNLLKGNKHFNGYLQSSWNKYGESVFEFLILEIIDDCMKVKEREQYWIDNFECYNRDKGYNMSPVSVGTLGMKMSNEVRQKMSETRRGENGSFFGKKHTEEAKRRMSQKRAGKFAGEDNPFYGKTHTEETKEKLRNRNFPSGPEHHNYGKTMSDESRAKLSASCKGRPSSFKGKKHTPESIAKMSQSRKGQHAGENNPMYGRPRTDEVKRKLREAHFGTVRPKKDGQLKGVSLTKKGDKWRSRIRCNGKEINLGEFLTPEEAARNYDYYSLRLHGDKAVLNYPEFDYSSFQLDK